MIFARRVHRVQKTYAFLGRKNPNTTFVCVYKDIIQRRRHTNTHKWMRKKEKVAAVEQHTLIRTGSYRDDVMIVN